jgi:hypothetical protein
LQGRLIAAAAPSTQLERRENESLKNMKGKKRIKKIAVI